MSESMNLKRAKLAKAALKTFEKQTGTDPESAVRDLIGDLMHYMIYDIDNLGLSPFREIWAALDFTQSEIEQELADMEDAMIDMDERRPAKRCFDMVMEAADEADALWKSIIEQKRMLVEN